MASSVSIAERVGGSSSWEACSPSTGVRSTHLAHCLEVVPASPSDSYRLVSSFFVSNKIVVLFLALLSTIRSGWIGLLEGIIGFAIGYFVTPSLERPRPLIRCPAFIVSSLTVHLPMGLHLQSLFSANIPPQQYTRQPSRRAPQQEYSHRGDYETEVVVDEEKVQELMVRSCVITKE